MTAVTLTGHSATRKDTKCYPPPPPPCAVLKPKPAAESPSIRPRQKMGGKKGKYPKLSQCKKVIRVFLLTKNLAKKASKNPQEFHGNPDRLGPVGHQTWVLRSSLFGGNGTLESC